MQGFRAGRGLNRRVAGLLAMLAALAAVQPAVAAEEAPTYDGAMTFGSIDGPSDPEDFSWRVSLREGQELQLLNDQHAVVRYEGGVTAMLITAQPAHDSIGSSVPTTLSVTGADVITLTVHHRAGNPAAGGAPFAYPVVGGAGWEGGYDDPVIVKGPPDEAELAEMSRPKHVAEEADGSPPLEPRPLTTRTCDPVVNPYEGTRYEGVDLTRIRARGVSCAVARRVARRAHRKALGLAPPPDGIRRFGWRGWRVRGDLRPSSDRYVARKGARVVRWRF